MDDVNPANGAGTVNQPAPYRVTVENRGSADLRNVVVRCQFPADMRPRAATNGGERFREAVQWVFKELKPGDVKELNVALTTASPGTARPPRALRPVPPALALPARRGSAC